MKKVLLICSTLILSTFLIGQTLITGKITDSRTGEPLVGANVLAEDSGGIGSTTNTEGEYSFS
ncbi:MAG: carboxypeptidase-like regulatory domain-containing protein, partial [Candidatus Marinimicrobia bacterium]|nr:carboxypeptidase-like regulatory domain-containing protein [Candidatus Neomarinimicrobiota bacterium]